MANNKHVAVLKQGAEVWNLWRRKTNERPELGRAVLSDADPSQVDMRGVDLRGADLSDADLVQVDMRGVDLSGANLTRANLIGADLTDADLIQADMRGVDLRGANLSRANLGGANLSNADLSDADISYAKLIFADLSGANLRHANLSDANLSNSDLSHADLDGAELSFANLSHADLRGANLHDTGTGYTTFANSDLSQIKGLDCVRHHGPCTIGVDTVYRSKGKIPESFLRGCGVPDGFITQMHSLVCAEDGIQFYSCFISYSGKDEDFANRLHGKMRDAHLRVWFAPEDIQGGKKLHEQIETAIRVFDKLLVVLSDASLQSAWVMDELRKGFKAERDTGRRKLFPLRLTDYETLEHWECRDSLSGKDLAEEVRQYFIPDFSNWKDHDQFEAAFARLLKDLRAEEHAK